MKSIVVANWKMNPATFRDAKKLLNDTKDAVDEAKNVHVIVAPPALYIKELRAQYKGKKISFAAQNAHFESIGSFTGEISPVQVRDAKVTHVIVGHAERRAMGETNEDVRKKIAAALEAKLVPILCVGEVRRSHDGDYYAFVREQIVVALRDVAASKLSSIIIAYEPVWAIGAEKPMSPREMHEMAIFVRKTIVESHGAVGMSMKILYGGAIDETNAAAMIQGGDVNGLLVGRASTSSIRFAALLDALSSV